MPRHAPLSIVRDIRIATLFLTRIPVGWVQDMAVRDLARAGWAFPIIGVAVAGVSGAVMYGAAGANLHPLACAFIGLGVMALITGALHEDGLADVADGVGGGTDKARILEIMRDSRIGSFGVLALVFSVGIRAAALSGMPGPGVAWLSLVAAAMFSRGVLPIVMTLMPAARSDGLSRNAGAPSIFVSLMALGLGLVGLFASLTLAQGFLAIILSVFLAGLLLIWAYRRLGGQTGDVLGAVQQVTEMAVLVAAASWSIDF